MTDKMKPIPENIVNKVLEAAILGGYIRPGGRTERENEEYTSDAEVSYMRQRGKMFP